MISQVVFTVLSLCSVISAEPVLGGDFVRNPTKFPYVVKVDTFVTIKKTSRDTSFDCVGVIVNPSVVLTAAHCIYEETAKVTKILITAGSIDLNDSGKTKQRLAKAYKVHEKYTEATDNWIRPNLIQPNDIAIIWLRAPLVMTEFIKHAKFPTEKASVDNVDGVSVGWGVQDSGYVSDDLKRVSMKGVKQKECVKKYGYFISENTFCGLSVDGKSAPSVGDSGCPFIVNNEVLGLYSFGKSLPITRENGQQVPSIHPDKPIVYTDIFSYRKWIKQSAESEAPKNLCNFSKKFPRMCALP